MDRVRLLDAYAGLTIDSWELSFGKQSLWWSPMQSGPLMFSDNADPVNMLRINRVSPLRLPSILGLFGPIRVEWFLGQTAGHEFFAFSDTGAGLFGQLGYPLARQPFIQGQKLAFKPTPDFEFSVTLTAVFSGGPVPLTWHNFIKTYSINAGNG